ncbi:hypothetical protein EX30DRAFT_398014 [Ascodesmis nigricans]|uniref:lytic cellulose monooxygenase (C4-dehydrogenating) n=1 Tax=Ascodesmis nigricans TaxID=341454 RepID=A0A4V3SHZ0_9PEZI|nr:hypothetical protein EX30DRAFT_398014 [Ascodesmis nigricans]
MRLGRALTQIALVALLGVKEVAGHYFFNQIAVNGAAQGEWKYIRQPPPQRISDRIPFLVTDENMRCNEKNPAKAETLKVKAGAELTWTLTLGSAIYHPGPSLVYLFKVPAGQQIADYDFSGNPKGWFKIHQEIPAQRTARGTATSVKHTIPKDLANGDYIIRIENLGLHNNDPEVFPTCGQITVEGGGNGAPGADQMVQFPGAYQPGGKGLTMIYNVQGDFVFPGPALWTGGGGGGGAAPPPPDKEKEKKEKEEKEKKEKEKKEKEEKEKKEKEEKEKKEKEEKEKKEKEAKEKEAKEKEAKEKEAKEKKEKEEKEKKEKEEKEKNKNKDTPTDPATNSTMDHGEYAWVMVPVNMATTITVIRPTGKPLQASKQPSDKNPDFAWVKIPVGVTTTVNVTSPNDPPPKPKARLVKRWFGETLLKEEMAIAERGEQLKVPKRLAKRECNRWLCRRGWP